MNALVNVIIYLFNKVVVKERTFQDIFLIKYLVDTSYNNRWIFLNLLYSFSVAHLGEVK